jgi:hypothetical protein
MNSDQSWYSAPVTRAVYDQYISLDTNRNGMLSKDEMYQYNGGSISPLVIDRLFESCRLYEAADGVRLSSSGPVTLSLLFSSTLESLVLTIFLLFSPYLSLCAVG